MVLYTDDVLCRGTRKKSADFYDAFTAKFHCASDPQYLTEEDPLDFVGFNITTKTIDGKARYWIDQEKALCQFLESIDMSSVRKVTCPMPDKWELVSDSTLLEPVEATSYRRMLGSISYFSTTTRYDIAHACSRLGQFNQSPTVGARKALYRVIGYLASTTDFKIGGKYATEDKVSFFCDSDLAGDRALTLRSQTGMIFLLNGMPIYWKSHRQPVTSVSSAAAEICAMYDAVVAARLYKWRCEEMGMHIPSPLLIQCDNTQGVSFQHGSCKTSNIRGTFDLRSQWVRELRDAKEIRTTHVPGGANPADLFTKCHPGATFNKLVKLIKWGGNSKV